MVQVAVFIFALVLVLSPLLIHELGHWALLRRHNVPVTQTWIGLGPAIAHIGKLRIGMLPIGAAVMPEPQAFAALRPIDKVWIALAGPIASFSYGLALVALVWLLPLAEADKSLELLLPVAYLNFFLGALNLIPIPPLDGFQAYRFWREHKSRPISKPVQDIALRLGNGLVYGVGFFVLARFFI